MKKQLIISLIAVATLVNVVAEGKENRLEAWRRKAKELRACQKAKNCTAAQLAEIKKRRRRRFAAAAAAGAALAVGGVALAAKKGSNGESSASGMRQPPASAVGAPVSTVGASTSAVGAPESAIERSRRVAQETQKAYEAKKKAESEYVEVTFDLWRYDIPKNLLPDYQALVIENNEDRLVQFLMQYGRAK